VVEHEFRLPEGLVVGVGSDENDGEAKIVRKGEEERNYEQEA
jgi:hypothetical protein